MLHIEKQLFHRPQRQERSRASKRIALGYESPWDQREGSLHLPFLPPQQPSLCSSQPTWQMEDDHSTALGLKWGQVYTGIAKPNFQSSGKMVTSVNMVALHPAPPPHCCSQESGRRVDSWFLSMADTPRVVGPKSRNDFSNINFHGHKNILSFLQGKRSIMPQTAGLYS